MRRSLTTFAIAAAAVALAAPLATATPPPPPPPSHSTTGSGTFYNSPTANGNNTSTITITTPFTGSPSSGSGAVHVVNNATGADYTGTINCYDQFSTSLSRATGTMSGKVSNGSGGTTTVSNLAFTMTVANGTPDKVALNHRAGSKPYDCTDSHSADDPLKNGSGMTITA